MNGDGREKRTVRLIGDPQQAGIHDDRLQVISGSATAVAPLCRLLAHEDAAVRCWAAHTLGRLQDPAAGESAVTALRAALSDDVEAVRVAAARALASAAGALPEAGLTDLLPRLRDLCSWWNGESHAARAAYRKALAAIEWAAGRPHQRLQPEPTG